MKTLIVSTGNEEDDATAARMITQEMVHGDTKHVIWYSHLAKNLAKVDALDKCFEMYGKNHDRLSEIHHRLAADHAVLRSEVTDLKQKFGAVEKKLAEVIKAKAEEEKKPKKEKK